MEENKAKGVSVLLVIILLIIGAICGWFIKWGVDTYLLEDKDVNNTQDTDGEVEDEFDEDEIVNQLVDMINENIHLDYIEKDLNISDLSNDDLLSMYFHSYYPLTDKYKNNEIPSKEEVEAYFMDNFNIEIVHNDVRCFIHQMFSDEVPTEGNRYYEYENGMYVVSDDEHQHGGGSVYFYSAFESFLHSYEISDDKNTITIIQNKLFYQYSGDTSGPDLRVNDAPFYNNENTIIEIDEDEFVVNGEFDHDAATAELEAQVDEFVDNYESNKDSMTKYEYTFEKVNGKYVLIGLSIN